MGLKPDLYVRTGIPYFATRAFRQFGFARGLIECVCFSPRLQVAFFGKLMAALFIAVCIAMGIGPEKWAAFVVSGLGDWATPFGARIAFLVLAIVTLVTVFGPWLLSLRGGARATPTATNRAVPVPMLRRLFVKTMAIAQPECSSAVPGSSIRYRSMIPSTMSITE